MNQLDGRSVELYPPGTIIPNPARRRLEHALRLGDIVAIRDYDSRYSHGYLRGAVGIAVIGQSDGPRAGYGPGMTLLMTDAKGGIKPVITPGTNLTTLLGLEP